MKRRDIEIPDKIRIMIRTQARNLLAIHRLASAPHVSVPLVQKMLEAQGELIAQLIFQSALDDIEKQKIGDKTDESH